MRKLPIHEYRWNISIGKWFKSCKRGSKKTNIDCIKMNWRYRSVTKKCRERPSSPRKFVAFYTGREYS